MMDSLTANQPITDTSVLICLPKGKFAIHNCIVYLGRGMWMWKVHDQTSICDEIGVRMCCLLYIQRSTVHGGTKLYFPRPRCQKKKKEPNIRCKQ